MSQAKPPNAARMHRIKVVGENFIQLLRKVKTPCELLAFSDIEPPTKDLGFHPEKARKLVKLLDVLNGNLPPPPPKPCAPVMKPSMSANMSLAPKKSTTPYIKKEIY